MTELPADREEAPAPLAERGPAQADVPALLVRVEECLAALAEGDIERVHELQELLRALRPGDQAPAEDDPAALPEG